MRNLHQKSKLGHLESERVHDVKVGTIEFKLSATIVIEIDDQGIVFKLMFEYRGSKSNESLKHAPEIHDCIPESSERHSRSEIELTRLALKQALYH